MADWAYRMIVIAVFALVGAQPGLVFGWPSISKSESNVVGEEK